MKPDLVTYDTDPSRYAHWKMAFKGKVATLTLDIQEDRGIRPGYKLKLNSYDLGVDIELNDALQRIRFEHPEVKTVVLTSGKPRMFCSGANIYMLGLSSHAWKVNFCKFTNETRNGIEESSRSSGLKFLAAVNGACAGGGYELALACDEIVMVDDRSTAVSLPEVPLLGVLPGTGGLTRLVDKRRVRRDLADVFSTTSEGVRAERARQWKLIDDAAKPQQFANMVEQHAEKLAALSDRPGGAGVALTPLQRRIDASGYHYETVDVAIDRSRRIADFTLKGPGGDEPRSLAAIHAAGDQWWALKFARELDDAILMLRTNDLEVGTWVFRSQGDVAAMLAMDAALADHASDWLVRETVNFLRRVLRRIDVSSRSIFALIEPGSCFAGTLFEVALAADRSYLLDSGEENAPRVALSKMNFGPLAMNNELTRLSTRFVEEQAPVEAARAAMGRTLDAEEVKGLGLVTFTPDALDWADEIRIALEERTSLSPDALTGMEANLRFAGRETMDTRVFGRLTAWQNWIFQRPNAVGEKGALKVYGSGNKSQFNW
ncbi:MAG TPA: 2,3-epoxybenzoyl-CoA dihydrolase, partial [Rhodocyclaceae bacterium]|nr:2,3-epoxybenzoyl-CoA dihydrolase [Rhodocyclaceae bacterium]